MTRRRSSAPGVPPARALSVLAFLVAVVVAACAGSTATPPPADGPASTATPSPVPVTEAPSVAPASAEPGPATPEPGPATPEPATPEPATEEPATEEPAPPSSAACTGTDENLAFFAEFAQVVDWTVYCPVLPRGWFVGTGQWRQAEGGRIEISYRGPGGAGLMLQEGSFCPGDGDCVPAGDDLGPADFGDRAGTLVATADGWAIVANRGERPSWLLTISGVSEEGARTIAADLVPVDA